MSASNYHHTLRNITKERKLQFFAFLPRGQNGRAMEFTIYVHRVSNLRIAEFILPRPMSVSGVHKNNFTFIPLLNNFLIHFKPVHITKLIYLRQALRLPSKLFLDVSGGIYRNDILKYNFRNFDDYLCVSCPFQWRD